MRDLVILVSLFLAREKCRNEIPVPGKDNDDCEILPISRTPEITTGNVIETDTSTQDMIANAEIIMDFGEAAASTFIVSKPLEREIVIETNIVQEVIK